MPIPPMIYSSVQLKINGRPVEGETIQLQRGTTIQVEGSIQAQPELAPQVIMGAGLALVTTADNERGWIVRWDRYIGGRTSHTNTDPHVLTRSFEGDYPVPDAPGEYVLVVLSDAHTGGDHPILIAAAYDTVIE